MKKDCDKCKFANYSAFDYPCNNCTGVEQWQEGTYEESDESETCKWELVFDGDFKDWHTECGEVFTLDSVPPAENGFKFCPYCGKRLEGSK